MMHYTAKHPEGVLKPTIDGWTPEEKEKEKEKEKEIVGDGLAWRLKKARDITGLNQRESARIIGITETSYHDYASGRYEPRREDMREKVYGYLKEVGV